MPRRKETQEPPSTDQLRELRQAVREAKAGYHEAKAKHDAEQMAFYSERITETMAAMNAAEEAANG